MRNARGIRAVSAGLGLGVAAIGAAHADVIAFQDFTDNTTLAGQVTLPGDAEAAGTVFDSARGLGWTLDSSDLGDTDADTIGVVSTSSLAGSKLGEATGIDGNWFSAQDTDGDLVLTFDQVITAGYTDLTLAFNWAAAAAMYETNDFFKVLVNGSEVFGVSETGLGGSGGDFATKSLDLSAFDGQTLDIAIQFTTSAADEEIGFDSLKLEGVLVPLPGAGGLALAGLLGLGMGRRRR